MGPTTSDNSEHGPEWVRPLALLRSPGGWNRARFDQQWVDTMLRRFAAQHPNHLATWLTLDGWSRVMLRRVQPNDPKPDRWVEGVIQKFMTAGGNRRGPENPWCIVTRQVPKSSYTITQYSITHIPPPFDYHAEVERLGLPELELTAAEFRALINPDNSAMDWLIETKDWGGMQRFLKTGSSPLAGTAAWVAEYNAWLEAS